MIARNVTMRLKADSVAEFSRILETEVLPLLRKQAGFQDDISFISKTGARRLASVSGIRRTTPKAMATEVIQRR